MLLDKELRPSREKVVASGGWRWLYYCKTLWYLRAAGDWTYRHGRKTQHFNYYKLWYLFLYFGMLHSKSAILLGLCLVLANDKSPSILLGGLKVNYNVGLRNDFSTHF